MRSQATIRNGYIAAEFLTRTYRVSGEVKIKTGDALLDQMNDHMALFISVERMYISPVRDPAVLTGNFEIGEVRKDRLGAVVLSQERDGLPRMQGRYVGRDHVERPVLIVTGGFEVNGVIPLHPTVNVSNFIRTTPEQFLPVFKAEATLTANRDIVFRGGCILINRAQIEVFCQLRKS